MSQNLFKHHRPKSPAVLSLLLFAAAGLALLGCQSEAPPEPDAEQVLRVRMREEPPDTDPAQSGDSLSDQINLNLHDGLVDFEPASLEVVPAVAERWEVSPDGRLYSFYLRSDVKFHNGRTLTADDVIYSFQRVLDPDVNSKRKNLFEKVEGASEFGNGEKNTVEGFEKVDESEIRIRLIETMPHFLQLLATPAASIIPKEVYQDPDQGYLEHPVGCGPFRFSRWERSNFLELTAHPDYYRGRPRLDRVLFRFIEKCRQRHGGISGRRAGVDG